MNIIKDLVSPQPGSPHHGNNSPRAAGRKLIGASEGVIPAAVGRNAVDSPRKVIVITGASRGIGLAVLKHFALSPYYSQAGGLDIVMLAGTQEPLMTVHNDLLVLIQQNFLHTRLLPFVADLGTDVFSASSKIGLQIQNVFGRRVDLVVYNAGLLEPIRRIGNMDKQDYARAVAAFNVNTLSVLRLTSELLPALRASPAPRIVVVSSGAAANSMAGWSVYCASKAAVNSIVSTLAIEEPGITCVAVSPGPVESGMQQLIRTAGSTDMDPKDYDYFVGLHERGELTKEIDAAELIASVGMLAPPVLSGKFVSIKEEVCQTMLTGYRTQIRTAQGPNV